MNLSIVIPAYNEEKRIIPTINKIYEFFKDNLDFEIIVVNDGSVDKTSNLLLKLGKDNLKVIEHKANLGKGAAIKTGAIYSKGSLILIIDADCSGSLLSYKDLEKAINNNCSIAIGSRALVESKIKAKLSRKIIGRIFASYINLLFGLQIKDTQCGFKLFNAEILKSLCQELKINKFAYDVELLYLAKKRNLKISEVPIEWNHVTGSKINVIRDGLKMFFDCLLIKIRLG